VAVPLSLAIAMASGVPPQTGLVTAGVAGIFGGLFGGTTLAVTGPAAAISVLIANAVASHGLISLPLITVGVGTLQVLSGYIRGGFFSKYCPVPVIAGFTTGVGCIIITGQLPKALGLPPPPTGLSAIEVLQHTVHQASDLSSINPAAVGISLSTAALMLGVTKLNPKLPNALLAVGATTAAVEILNLDVSKIGKLPDLAESFRLTTFVVPELSQAPALAATTVLIYVLCSVESLLSCVSLTKMYPADQSLPRELQYPYNANQELIGQGMANIAAGCVAGMPVTSVIARSGLNARLGANTRLAALIQSGVVLSSLVYLGPIVESIPIPSLAGILLAVGSNMLVPSEIFHAYAVQKN